jgi:hypothetical protein
VACSRFRIWNGFEAAVAVLVHRFSMKEEEDTPVWRHRRHGYGLSSEMAGGNGQLLRLGGERELPRTAKAVGILAIHRHQPQVGFGRNFDKFSPSSTDMFSSAS